MNLLPELILGPSENRPRTMRICWYPTHVTAAVYGPTGYGTRYSFATAKHAETRLDLGYDRLFWLDSACFDLTELEALQIRTILEPHGLRIQTLGSTHPADTSHTAGYEAATTAVCSPSCDDGGTPPPRFSAFGGSSEMALEDDNRTLVSALTCNEGY